MDLALTVKRQIIVELAYNRVGYEVRGCRNAVKLLVFELNYAFVFTVRGVSRLILQVMVPDDDILLGNNINLIDGLVLYSFIKNSINYLLSWSLLIVVDVDDGGGGRQSGVLPCLILFPCMGLYFYLFAFREAVFLGFKLCQQLQLVEKAACLFRRRSELLGGFEAQYLLQVCNPIQMLFPFSGQIDIAKLHVQHQPYQLLLRLPFQFTLTVHACIIRNYQSFYNRF